MQEVGHTSETIGGNPEMDGIALAAVLEQKANAPDLQDLKVRSTELPAARIKNSCGVLLGHQFTPPSSIHLLTG